MFHDRLPVVGQDLAFRVSQHWADHRTGMPQRLPSLKVALSARTQVNVLHVYSKSLRLRQAIWYSAVQNSTVYSTACSLVGGWRDSCQMPTIESTKVGWVFNERNVPRASGASCPDFRGNAPCSDSLDTQPTLVTNAGFNSKQLHW